MIYSLLLLGICNLLSIQFIIWSITSSKENACILNSPFYNRNYIANIVLKDDSNMHPLTIKI